MAARWTALAIGMVILSIISIFVGAVLRPPPASPPNTGELIERSGSEGKRMIARAGSWTAAVDLTQSPGGAVAVVLSITDAEGRPATFTVPPTALMNMVNMAMPGEPVTLVQEEPGVWRGSGEPSMAGRWSLRIEIDGERISLPFEALPPR